MIDENLQAIFTQMRDQIKGQPEFAAKVVPSKGIPSLEVWAQSSEGQPKMVVSVDILTDREGNPLNQWKTRIYDPILAEAPVSIVQSYATQHNINLSVYDI